MSETERRTVARLTTGDRVLITDHSEYAGGGRGTWRAARSVNRRGSRYAPGEPAGMHAATVLEVRANGGRWDVVTNLGTVESVSRSQPLRLAPDDMEDSAVVRARLAAERAKLEALRAYELANPRDMDGVHTAPGDLVELLDLGGGGAAGEPVRVSRLVRGSTLGAIIHRPYAPASRDTPAGHGLAPSHAWRRLADQQDRQTARRSCGCPAPIDQPIPDPPERPFPAHIVREVFAPRSAPHLPGCCWAPRPGQDRIVLRALPDVDENGGRTFAVHRAVNVEHPGYPCGCPGVGRYDGDRVAVYDLTGLRLALHRPQARDNGAPAPAIAVAVCCPAAMFDEPPPGTSDFPGPAGTTN